jgi:NAD(P)H dehydrogenase (quinone)
MAMLPMRTKPRILVTGASGKTGRAVAAQLLAAEHPVRALVHRLDGRAAALERSGVEVVVADMHDPDQLAGALRDVQSVYYVPIFAPHAALAAMAFAAALRGSGVGAVVQLSQWLAQPSHPSILTRESWLVEQVFGNLPGVAHVILNPGMFADNFLRVMDFASLLRIYPVLTGDSRSAPVATEDIARTAVALLTDPDRHAGQRFRPTGPALLSGREMAAAIARVLGHGVLPIDLPFFMFRKLARLTGVNPHEVFSYRDYLADHRAGAFAFDGGVTDVVEQLTGTPAEPFESTARRYAAMPFARPSLANRMAMLARMAVVPLWPGYDLEGYARRLALPIPPTRRLSVEDSRWREERLVQNAQATSGPYGMKQAV